MTWAPTATGRSGALLNFLQLLPLLHDDGDGHGDVWTEWDIEVRYFIIVGRDGIELARINLTYNNPDPDSTCGENYETIKNLILSFR